MSQKKVTQESAGARKCTRAEGVWGYDLWGEEGGAQFCCTGVVLPEARGNLKKQGFNKIIVF